MVDHLVFACSLFPSYLQSSLLKLINNSQRKYKGNWCLTSVWKSDEKLLILHPWFLFPKSFCLRSNIKHSTQCFIIRWNTSKFVKNTPLRCISCLIYYIQSLPILHNFKHPPFLFIENSQEIIQKCLLIMEPLFDRMKSWLVLEENMLK